MLVNSSVTLSGLLGAKGVEAIAISYTRTPIGCGHEVNRGAEREGRRDKVRIEKVRNEGRGTGRG